MVRVFVFLLTSLSDAFRERERSDNDARRSGRGRTRKRGEGARPSVITERSLQQETNIATERCEVLEAELEADRWTPDHPDYLNALKYSHERSYLLAIDHLERLVVQRLLELEKCNIRGTSK